jgi:type VI secretion system secreted protein Hcp
MSNVNRVLVAVAAFILIPAAFANAQAVTVSVTGAKQGQFKGESRREKAKDKIEAVSFVFEVTSPRDVASGQASGKRQYKPLQITKPVGAASPQFFQALTSNETLSTVTLEFTKTDKSGEEFVYYTIRLTNASVASIRQHIPSDASPPAAPTGPLARGASAPPAAAVPMEEISFTFQKIEIENKEAKTMATDDWQQGR